MKPTPARLLAKLSCALAASLTLALSVLVATGTEAQAFVTEADRCREELAAANRIYVARVLVARIHCENDVISGKIPPDTNCISGLGDFRLYSKLLQAEAKLSDSGADCAGVDLELLDLPGACNDPNGLPFDINDFHQCVLDNAAATVATLLDYYYPPMAHLLRGSAAACVKGAARDASRSFLRAEKAREECLLDQFAGNVDQRVNCRAEILPYGPGTGDPDVDGDISSGYLLLLGAVPRACVDVPIDDLDYQSSCIDPTGGVFNIFDLKSCFFDLDRGETTDVLAVVFPPPPVCGDGIVSGEEECDLGNGANSDTKPNTCRTNCTNPRCHDGVTDTTFSEQCDDGNTVDTDCCVGACKLATCGDGIKSCTEQCEDGNTVNTDACTNVCKNAVCGDGFKRTGVEACDDGNTVNEDGCSSLCLIESCGDEIVQAGRGEQCDNGVDNSNTIANACRTDCKNAHCGDHVIDTNEVCDDGNTASGDGCSSTCTVEFICGDGTTSPGEQCDDANTVNTDACVACKNAFCGDGFTRAGVEQCDDANSVNTDACAQCQNAVCGDGFTRAGVEECDNGGSNSNTTPDACRTNCKTPRCPDGVTDPSNGEECDDGNTNNDDACPNTCSVCGNGTKSASEECDTDSSVCPPGEGCKGDCECAPACPSEGELVLYAGIGRDCDTNTDCPAGSCDQEDGRCHTVTRLDSGWTGVAHGADINDGVRTRGFLSCDGHGPTCGECEVTGIDPQTNTCRCSNQSRTVCDQPFNVDADDCPACAGGTGVAGNACGVNTDCVATPCRARCRDSFAPCTTNADCPSGAGFCSAALCSVSLAPCASNADCTGGGGTCPVTKSSERPYLCSNGKFCSANADCTGNCTDKATCDCYFGSPFPLSSGNTGVCVVNRFSEDITGTANVDLGAGEITAKLRTQVFGQITVPNPCPSCGGRCSNNASVVCNRDLECSGGTCTLDPMPDDGVRQGICIGAGDSEGLPCDPTARNTSFPAFPLDPPGPGGALYSLDCMPAAGNNYAGTGLIINLTQTTGTQTLEGNVPCGGDSTHNCPCRLCSGDRKVTCNIDDDCDGQQGFCSAVTANRCSVNTDCDHANIGPCVLVNVQLKCQLKKTQVCGSNADCFADVGPCNPSTCSFDLDGSSGVATHQSSCVDDLCTDNGGGIGTCTLGPDSRSCDGVLKANGDGIWACSSDEECSASTTGQEAGSCTLVQPKGCFLDPIVAVGEASPSKPIGAAAFCIPPTTSSNAINSVAGLPGPGRIRNQATARTFCESNTQQQYIPGVGGCLPP